MSKSNDFEELKKRFIIDDDKYEAEKWKADLIRLLQYSKITKSGRVLVFSSGLREKDEVGLVLVSRLIGNRLAGNIPASVNIAEIANYLGLDITTVNRCIKELVNEGFAVIPERNICLAVSNKVRDFLEKLQG